MDIGAVTAVEVAVFSCQLKVPPLAQAPFFLLVFIAVLLCRGQALLAENLAIPFLEVKIVVLVAVLPHSAQTSTAFSRY